MGPGCELPGHFAEATLDALLYPCPQELWHAQARGLCTGPFLSPLTQNAPQHSRNHCPLGLHVSHCLVASHCFVLQLWAVPLPPGIHWGHLGCSAGLQGASHAWLLHRALPVVLGQLRAPTGQPRFKERGWPPALNGRVPGHTPAAMRPPRPRATTLLLSPALVTHAVQRVTPTQLLRTGVTTMAVSEGRDPFLSQDSLLQEARPWTAWGTLMVGTLGGVTGTPAPLACAGPSQPPPWSPHNMGQRWGEWPAQRLGGRFPVFSCHSRSPGESAFPCTLTTSCSATWKSLALRLAQGNAAPRAAQHLHSGPAG